jgi:hypothetical protein
MVSKVLVALALALGHVDGFPTDQQVQWPVVTGLGIEANGVEEVRYE